MSINKTAKDWLASNYKGSYWAWPWQMLTGGIRIIPAIGNMVPGYKSKNKEKRDKAYRNAAMLQTTACSILLAGGVVGAGRLFKYMLDRRGVTSGDNPAAGLQNGLNTTYKFNGRSAKLEEADKREDKPQDAEELTDNNNPQNEVLADDIPQDTSDMPKEASRHVTPRRLGILNLGDSVRGAIPIIAAAATAGLAHMGAEHITAAMNDDRISRKLKMREDFKNKLFTARAKNARNNLTEEEYEALGREYEDTMKHIESGSLEKYACIDKTALIDWFKDRADEASNVLTILVAALATTSAVGTYWYTRATDPGNIKYKAHEKGLKEYAKSRTARAPLTITQPSDEWIAEVEGTADAEDAEKAPRKPATLDTYAPTTPISVSF